MSSTLLEMTRACHEEVERLERLISKDLRTQYEAPKDRLYQNHRVRNMIEQITQTTHKLVDVYEDKDNARRDEIAALGGQSQSLRTGVVPDLNDEFEQFLKEKPHIEFSGEEASGRDLDLHELFNVFINSKFSKKFRKEVGKEIDYSEYLDIFSRFDTIPRKYKLTRQYKEYLVKLLEYLVYFRERTEPLEDVGRIFANLTSEFEMQWTNGHDPCAQHSVVIDLDHCNVSECDSSSVVIDLDQYSTVEELMRDVGPDKLKEALAALGLKVGGNAQQRAERLFLTKHTPINKLEKKRFAKTLNDEALEDPGRQVGGLDAKGIAFMEAKIRKLCDLLHNTIVSTKENIVKKQAMSTYAEIVLDRVLQDEDQQPAKAEGDDDDEEQHGKPIPVMPYWLYKLHGLGQEFKCEICGNHSYWGRRAYEQHFKEWRHQHGMRCLGIPNTNNFNEITSIEEAKELWRKIQDRQGLKKWRPDLEEEYEDQEGNIYNKRTFTDLQRQGLI